MAAPLDADRALGPLDEAYKFFMANLPLEATPKDIREHFTQFGIVNFVKLIQHKDTGKNAGYGFLYMNDRLGDAAVDAHAMASNFRVTIFYKSHCLLQRHDRNRAKPLRNKISHDEDKIVIPAAQQEYNNPGYAATHSTLPYSSNPPYTAVSPPQQQFAHGTTDYTYPPQSYTYPQSDNYASGGVQGQQYGGAQGLPYGVPPSYPLGGLQATYTPAVPQEGAVSSIPQDGFAPIGPQQPSTINGIQQGYASNEPQVNLATNGLQQQNYVSSGPQQGVASVGVPPTYTLGEPQQNYNSQGYQQDFSSSNGLPPNYAHNQPAANVGGYYGPNPEYNNQNSLAPSSQTAYAFNHNTNTYNQDQSQISYAQGGTYATSSTPSLDIYSVPGQNMPPSPYIPSTQMSQQIPHISSSSAPPLPRERGYTPGRGGTFRGRGRGGGGRYSAPRGREGGRGRFSTRGAHQFRPY